MLSSEEELVFRPDRPSLQIRARLDSVKPFPEEKGEVQQASAASSSIFRLLKEGIAELDDVFRGGLVKLAFQLKRGTKWGNKLRGVRTREKEGSLSP